MDTLLPESNSDSILSSDSKVKGPSFASSGVQNKMLAGYVRSKRILSFS